MQNAALFSETLSQSPSAADFLGSVIQASTEYSIIAKDLEGRIILWNEGARRLYGYTPDEVIGKSADILHAPEDIALGLPETMREAALKHGRWEGVISRITKNQLRISVRVVITPRIDEKGTTIGFLLVSKDVSNEYRLRERIERTKLLSLDAFGTHTEDLLEFLITLLEASTEYSIIALDLSGQIVLWNEGARRVYGYDAARIVGKANISILHRESDRMAGLPQRILDSARQHGSWLGDVQRSTESGSIFTARVVVTPRYDASRTMRGYLVISHPLHSQASH